MNWLRQRSAAAPEGLENMRKRRARGEESMKPSDAVVIGPYEVMLIGKTVEALRALPRGLKSKELWDRLEAALAFDTGASIRAGDASVRKTGGVRVKERCAE
jgi:hypothetical protein